MNEFEKKKCLELTNKMHKMDLCRPFKDKVDPVRDGAPDYFQIVKRPMDLTTIRRKLNGNDYKSIDAWATDVNQVWTNAKLYNNEGTLIYVMAQEMEIWFGRKLESMPRNKDEEWMEMLRKSTKKLFDLSRHPPSSIVAVRPLISLASALQADSSIPAAAMSVSTADLKPETEQKSQSETSKNSNTSTIALQQPVASILKNKPEKNDKNEKSDEKSIFLEEVSNQESPQRSASPSSRPPSTPPAQMSSSPPLSPKPTNSKSQQSTDGEKQEESAQESKTQETSENEEEVGDL